MKLARKTPLNMMNTSVKEVAIPASTPLVVRHNEKTPVKDSYMIPTPTPGGEQKTCSLTNCNFPPLQAPDPPKVVAKVIPTQTNTVVPPEYLHHKKEVAQAVSAIKPAKAQTNPKQQVPKGKKKETICRICSKVVNGDIVIHLQKEHPRGGKEKAKIHQQLVVESLKDEQQKMLAREDAADEKVAEAKDETEELKEVVAALASTHIITATEQQAIVRNLADKEKKHDLTGKILGQDTIVPALDSAKTLHIAPDRKSVV